MTNDKVAESADFTEPSVDLIHRIAQLTRTLREEGWSKGNRSPQPTLILK